ncbi:hypothetical protein JD292_08200 [Leucobacter sp. CSA2]|uniref:HTH luxR-type domain-containing protein n=1 Tax=Leucobacter edaphi TaxID=2796472 RepID=A0A934QCD8_9MICO|nr:LuxR C-terminal-related transcriptional regulator [Leucobacter edaphi]MBK0422054.1 hypothetical protein [Leucobacter edaphi]
MLIAAAQRLVGSSLRDGLQPELRQLEILRSANLAEVRKFADSEQKLVAAGMLMAHVRADDTFGAVELARLVRERKLNRMQPPDPMFGFLAIEAALAETYIAAGMTVEATKHTERLIQGMSEGASPRWHLRAFGLCAAAHAIDGHHRIAQEYLGRISALKEREGWEEDRVEYMDAVAEAVLGFTALNSSRLQWLKKAAETLPQREPTSQSLIQLINTVAATTADDASDIISMAGSVARGSMHPSGPSFVRQCALGVAAVELVQRGTPGQAIALLRGARTPPNHSVCFASVRASAYIVMGDYRASLAASDACVRERASHNRWMLPGALLARAIANMHLGHVTEAVATGADALSLSESLVSPRLGLLALPRRDILALGSRIAVARPRLLRRLLQLRDEMDQVPPLIPAPLSLPKLSQRERVVALRLRSDLSYSQLAEEMHVSASTIKSQANMIARKLGGRTREDAVERLEKSGFYAIYAPDGY